jgi:hypothetical protein
VTPGSRRSGRGPGRPRRGPHPLPQLAIDFAPEPPRWRFSRLVLRSRHRERIHERLQFVRGFFPELEGVTVRVGLARKPGVLGWGSLDPEDPGVWVRPWRLDAFTIAHEFTHLLQARRLVPRGERACDLWALARSPLLVDTPPGYLRIPAALRRQRVLSSRDAACLHRTARRALDARTRGERGYLRYFERELEAAMREPVAKTGPPRAPVPMTASFPLTVSRDPARA